MEFSKFMPLVKMEEQSDGTLMVFGLVTAQQPDLDKEVCDYVSTKAYYEKRRDENLAKTSIAGMTPSVMPFREMHQVKVQGAGRTMVFDDVAKTIKMGFQVVTAEAVKMWKAGCFTGFSQGGSYVKQWPDPEFDGCQRYTADPMEVSAVDAPCLPIALVESMKGRVVSLMKISGVTEQVPLQIPALDALRIEKLEREVSRLQLLEKARLTKTVDGVALPAASFAHVGSDVDVSTWLVPIDVPGDIVKTKAAVQDALSHFEERSPGLTPAQKRAARRAVVKAANGAGIEPTAADKAAATKACATISLVKGLYEVGWLASLIEDLNWLIYQAEWERDVEADDSQVPADLRDAWKELIAQLKAMVIEESDEALSAAGGKGEKGMKITDQAGLTKAAKTLSDHLAKHMEMHKALHEKMEGTLSKDHPIMKAHDAMMDHCEKCMKAAKDAGAGEEPEEAEKVAVAKAADTDAKIAELTKAVAALTEKLEKTAAPAADAPHTGAGLSKGAKDVEFEALLSK